MTRRLDIFLPLIASIIIAAGSTFVCYRAAGPSLGLFLGGFLVATVIAPTAFLTQQSLAWRLIALAVTTTAIAGVWLIAIFTTPDTFLEWLQLTLTLFAYAAAIAAVAAILSRIHFPVSIATAFAILLGVAWLTWPVWLSSTLASTGSDRLNAALVIIHPPLVANGVLLNEPPWSEKPLAYRWTNLNQDIPTHLPTNALACMLFHGLCAIGLITLASVKLKSSPAVSPSA